jgi:hypothetical protein
MTHDAVLELDAMREAADAACVLMKVLANPSMRGASPAGAAVAAARRARCRRASSQAA